MIKRSLTIAGHRTSISLEEPFWQALVAIAAEQQISIAELVAQIDAHSDGTGLSSRVRVFILRDAQTKARH